MPVKCEPQDLQWSHEQITVHSGILKFKGEKSYHPYLSATRKHDQHFAQLCILEILRKVDFSENPYIVIEGDNCSYQYKSSAHFHGMQTLAKKFQVNVIRIFGIAEHGKGEVDHVGGLAKTTLQRAIAAGEFFNDVGEMVEYLHGTLHSTKHLQYTVKETDEKVLESERRLKVFPSIDGSNKFQVMLFKPNSTSFVAANRICICNTCKTQYGTCSLFKR